MWCTQWRAPVGLRPAPSTSAHLPAALLARPRPDTAPQRGSPTAAVPFQTQTHLLYLSRPALPHAPAPAVVLKGARDNTMMCSITYSLDPTDESHACGHVHACMNSLSFLHDCQRVFKSQLGAPGILCIKKAPCCCMICMMPVLTCEQFSK